MKLKYLFTLFSTRNAIIIFIISPGIKGTPPTKMALLISMFVINESHNIPTIYIGAIENKKLENGACHCLFFIENPVIYAPNTNPIRNPPVGPNSIPTPPVKL